MTLRIELFQIWLKEMNFLKKKNDSKNWMFFQYFSKKWFFLWLKGLIFLRRKELNLFFSLNMTQRIEFFLWIWRKELNPFSGKMTQRIELSPYATQRIVFFFSFASKNWAFFLNLTQRIELFFEFDSKGLNLFIEYDSKNWTFLSLTQRYFFEYDSKNLTFFEFDSKGLNLFHWIWRIELNLILSMIYRIESLFLSMTQRTELFFEYDSMNRTHFLNVTQKLKFLVGKKSKILNFFFLKTQNWFFQMTRRIEPAFFNMTQRI